MADQADCVLVFGASLNFLTTSFGTSLPQVPLIQVDALRTNIGRWFPAPRSIRRLPSAIAEGSAWPPNTLLPTI